MTDRALFLSLLLSITPLAVWAADPPERPSPEENILQKAGVAADDAGMLAFFRGRTPTDAESKQVRDLIRRLGADDFNDRERASEALRKFGDRAVPPFRPDAEGFLTVPDKPGLGIELNREALKRFGV